MRCTWARIFDSRFRALPAPPSAAAGRRLAQVARRMLKPALQLKLGQQLTMTPQLQQAIRLLQLPVLELQAQIREALETNVMLEPEEEAGVPKPAMSSSRS